MPTASQHIPDARIQAQQPWNRAPARRQISACPRALSRAEELHGSSLKLPPLLSATLPKPARNSNNQSAKSISAAGWLIHCAKLQAGRVQGPVVNRFLGSFLLTSGPCPQNGLCQQRLSPLLPIFYLGSLKRVCFKENHDKPHALAALYSQTPKGTHAWSLRTSTRNSGFRRPSSSLDATYGVLHEYVNGINAVQCKDVCLTA